MPLIDARRQESQECFLATLGALSYANSSVLCSRAVTFQAKNKIIANSVIYLFTLD